MRLARRGPTGRDLATHAALLARLAADRNGVSGKLQWRLERVERLWRPFQIAYTIRDAMLPRRGVEPRPEELALVAGFYAHSSPEVRQRVVNALRHASTQAAAVLPVIRSALGDCDLRVRCAAVRAAHELQLGVELITELLVAIDAPSWNIRVHAAAALASTRELQRAADTFFASRPAGEGSAASRASEIWNALVTAFPPREAT